MSSLEFSTRPLRIGTRGSKLAMWQCDFVRTSLERLGHVVEVVVIKTEGDRDQTSSLANIGAPGVFTRGIQQALLDERVDLAVHSLKDLPTIHVEGLQISAVPGREDPRDVLISQSGSALNELPAGAKIGTGSVRRRAQLLHLRSDLKMLDIRGNVDSRIRKLFDGDYDAIVLAAAGLKRLELSGHVSHTFETSEVFPAVGQGALGIETRMGDEATIEAVSALTHPQTLSCVMAERAMLRELDSGCLAPIGARTRLEGSVLHLAGVVLSEDGTQRIVEQDTGLADESGELGIAVAEKLKESGATALLRKAVP
ncbi:MAG: hydroxymethylbilane synthase [Planctomycetota bacterium]